MKNEEKIPYLKALMYVSLADDSVDENEMDYFNQVGSMYGLTFNELEELKNSVVSRKEKLEEILNGIIERTTKLTLLYELLALCYVDDNYSDSEKETMRKVCSLLGIEEEKLSQLEDVMEENCMLQTKINNILER